MLKRLKNTVLWLILLLSYATYTHAKVLTIASTTSTDNSGFFAFILPLFTKETGIKTRVLAQGTGQAIRTAKNGDADVLFVHHKKSEIAFVKQGYGVKRYPVMYNDFVLIGPKSNPLGIHSSVDLKTTLKKFTTNKALFISRADQSGTNKKEKDLWHYATIIPKKSWYIETGSSMGATLNITSAKDAYTLSDRATWLAFKNKGNLTIVYENNSMLHNQYGIIAVNPKLYKNIQYKKAQTFIQWILSKHGQNLIKTFKIKNQQAFFPNAQ